MFFAPQGDPIGTVKSHAGAATPGGWLDCNGAAVSRATYAALFAAIGVAYGAGDGATTFNVPDFRGRAVIGAGNGAGLTARARGATGGAETHPLAVGEIPSHAHPGSVTDSQGSHSHTVNTYDSGGSTTGGTALAHSSINGSAATSAAGAHSHNVTVAAQGGGGAHNNMQPFGVAYFIIKY